MDNSAGHQNDDGKKASGTDASSSSDESSSSDDAEDGAVPAPLNRGENLAFQGRFGQGKQVRLESPSADDSSEDSSDSSIDRNDSAHSATTKGCAKSLAGKNLRRVLPSANNRSTKSVPRCFITRLRP